MRKISKKFDEIWSQADRRNKAEGTRFFRMFDQYKRYVVMGIYDSKTKRWATFDTINLIGNFRYNIKGDMPPEFREMQNLIER